MAQSFQNQKDEIWPSIASVLAPIVQLLLVLFAGISTFFNFQKFFFFPEFLNLINIFVLLATLACIACFWHWRNSTQFSIKKKKRKDGTEIFISQEQRVFNLIMSISVLSFLLLVVFVVMTIFYFLNLSFGKEVFAVLQYLSYSFFFVVTGLIIYIWLSEYLRKRNIFKREDFIKNLTNALGAHGIINIPQIKIWENQIAQNWTSRTVEVEISYIKYIVNTSVDGLEIFKIQEKAEHQSGAQLPVIATIPVVQPPSSQEIVG